MKDPSALENNDYLATQIVVKSRLDKAEAVRDVESANGSSDLIVTLAREEEFAGLLRTPSGGKEAASLSDNVVCAIAD